MGEVTKRYIEEAEQALLHTYNPVSYTHLVCPVSRDIPENIKKELDEYLYLSLIHI